MKKRKLGEKIKKLTLSKDTVRVIGGDGSSTQTPNDPPMVMTEGQKTCLCPPLA